MSTKISNWPAGTPMWVDLGVQDLEAAKGFYADLFGWQFLPGGQFREFGGGTAVEDYLLAHLGGRAVAGIGLQQDHAGWTTFLATDDAGVTARKIEAAGGRVTAHPRHAANSARTALAKDTAGAAFGVWQAGTHIGAERVNEHGSLCWNELRTPNYPAARSFYAEVFGHSYQEIPAEDRLYATIRRPHDGNEVAGLHCVSPLDPARGHWLTWFASDDVEATVRIAAERGSRLLEPLTEGPLGHTAIVQAPQGEVFGVTDAPRTSGFFRQPPDQELR
ncbi:VOC family protein [Arthrobacter sp. efr-133-TYG-104]|uniref:VOC family protein n=1 Tax=Arthrobacter sp. efr-133-TYG-104 TaxID=3040324 RepID=UPI002551074F|nr:VOC family protein [Arthrobacter sp. efr-133-TYG-104]